MIGRPFTGLPDPVLPRCRRCTGHGVTTAVVTVDVEVHVPVEVVTDGQLTVKYRTEWVPGPAGTTTVACGHCGGTGLEPPGGSYWQIAARGVAHWLLAKANQ